MPFHLQRGNLKWNSVRAREQRGGGVSSQWGDPGRGGGGWWDGKNTSACPCCLICLPHFNTSPPLYRTSPLGGRCPIGWCLGHRAQLGWQICRGGWCHSLSPGWNGFWGYPTFPVVEGRRKESRKAKPGQLNTMSSGNWGPQSQ